MKLRFVRAAAALSVMAAPIAGVIDGAAFAQSANASPKNNGKAPTPPPPPPPPPKRATPPVPPPPPRAQPPQPPCPKVTGDKPGNSAPGNPSRPCKPAEPPKSGGAKPK